MGNTSHPRTVSFNFIDSMSLHACLHIHISADSDWKRLFCFTTLYELNATPFLVCLWTEVYICFPLQFKFCEHIKPEQHIENAEGLHIMYACISAGLRIMVAVFFSAFNTWMRALGWSLKNWNEQNCHLFLCMLVFSLRLYHTLHRLLEQGFQEEGEGSLTCLCYLAQCNSSIVQITEFAPMRLLFFFLFQLGHATEV